MDCNDAFWLGNDDILIRFETIRLGKAFSYTTKLVLLSLDVVHITLAQL